MRNLLITSALCLMFASTAIAQTTVPTTGRTLTCKNNSGKIQIGICGIRGCTAVTSIGSTITKYTLTRKRNTNGSLTYTTRIGTTPKCTVGIGSLLGGRRLVTGASCATSLVGASCNIA